MIWESQVSLISELEERRNRYYKLIDNMNSICSHLDNSTTNIEKAIEYSNSFYRLNNEPADKNKLENTINEINNINDMITTKIIPSINSCISNLTIELNKIADNSNLLL